MDTKMSANKMFAILGRIADTESCFQAITSKDAHRWHCRYAHLNFKCLKTLYSKNMVIGLPHIGEPTKLYEDCLMGK